MALQVPYKQISKIFYFIALCLSFKTLSYLLVPREIQSRIFCSHPSEYDPSYVDNLEYNYKSHQINPSTSGAAAAVGQKASIMLTLSLWGILARW